jgi:hypothetical protein
MNNIHSVAPNTINRLHSSQNHIPTGSSPSWASCLTSFTFVCLRICTSSFSRERLLVHQFQIPVSIQHSTRSSTDITPKPQRILFRETITQSDILAQLHDMVVSRHVGCFGKHSARAENKSTLFPKLRVATVLFILRSRSVLILLW